MHDIGFPTAEVSVNKFTVSVVNCYDTAIGFHSQMLWYAVADLHQHAPLLWLNVDHKTKPKLSNLPKFNNFY